MKKFFLSGIMAVLCISVFAQTSASLKLNLEKNKVYRMKMTSEQSISQTINGNQQTTESKVDYSFSIKKMDDTPQFMITEIHFDTLSTNTNAMGKMTNISSVNEGDIKSSEVSDIMSSIMNRLSKNALFVKMDYSGKALEIVNLKMISDIILKDTGSISLTGMMAEGVKKQILNMVSDNSLKNMIEIFTYCLPGSQVSAGDSWNVVQMTNSGGMMLNINTTYHLDGIDGSMANITADSEIKPAGNASPIMSGGATVTYDDLKGLSKSTIVLNTATGLIVENRSKSHIAGNLGISAPGMTMQMPMDITGESVVTGLN